MWQYETIAPAISAANRISLSAQRMKAVVATSATSMTYLLADASTRTTPGQLLLVAYLALSVPGRVFVAEVALINSNGCYPGRQARGVVLRKRRRLFSRSEDRGSGESSIRESIPAFHYAQWKCNVDLELLELVSPETLLPATTVPILLIHGRDNRNTKKTLITKAPVVLERSFA